MNSDHSEAQTMVPTAINNKKAAERSTTGLFGEYKRTSTARRNTLH